MSILNRYKYLIYFKYILKNLNKIIMYHKFFACETILNLGGFQETLKLIPTPSNMNRHLLRQMFVR